MNICSICYKEKCHCGMLVADKKNATHNLIVVNYKIRKVVVEGMSVNVLYDDNTKCIDEFDSKEAAIMVFNYIKGELEALSIRHVHTSPKGTE